MRPCRKAIPAVRRTRTHNKQNASFAPNRGQGTMSLAGAGRSPRIIAEGIHRQAHPNPTKHPEPSRSSVPVRPSCAAAPSAPPLPFLGGALFIFDCIYSIYRILFLLLFIKCSNRQKNSLLKKMRKNNLLFCRIVVEYVCKSKAGSPAMRFTQKQAHHFPPYHIW